MLLDTILCSMTVIKIAVVASGSINRQALRSQLPFGLPQSDSCLHKLLHSIFFCPRFPVHAEQSRETDGNKAAVLRLTLRKPATIGAVVLETKCPNKPSIYIRPDISCVWLPL